MLVKTKAIILHTIPFKETSIIAYAYTKENGRTSFLVNNVRTKNSKTKLNLFQPLTILDIIYYSNRNNELCRIKDIKREDILVEIPLRIDKNCIATFISEFIYKVIREQDRNEALFEFLHYSILYLDKIEENISIFNLVFLIQLTKYVGIKPNNNYNELNKFFNLKSGSFISLKDNTASLNHHLSYALNTILTTDLQELELINIEKSERRELLKKIIQYYQIHLDYRLEIKSIQVLEEVFNF